MMIPPMPSGSRLRRVTIVTATVLAAVVAATVCSGASAALTPCQKATRNLEGAQKRLQKAIDQHKPPNQIQRMRKHVASLEQKVDTLCAPPDNEPPATDPQVGSSTLDQTSFLYT